MMPLIVILTSLGLLLLPVCTWAAEGQAKAAEWAKAREQVRKGRQAMEKGASEDRLNRAEKAAKIIQELLVKAPDLGVSRQDRDLADLVAGVRFLNPAAAEPLIASLAALPAAVDDSKAKGWKSLIDSKRKELLRPTERLFKQALDAGVPSVARDCLDQALTFWPDHKDVRRNLSEEKSGDRWYGPRDQQRLKAGGI
jgi:hypothetical protein